MPLIEKHGTAYEIQSSTAAPGQVVFHPARTGKQIARALVQVARCSVSDVIVFDIADRRNGIASALYDHIEREMGFTLVLNRLSLSDGRAFWKARQKLQRRALGKMAPRHFSVGRRAE